MAALSTGALCTKAFAEINFNCITGLSFLKKAEGASSYKNGPVRYEFQGLSLDYEWHLKYFNIFLGLDWKENMFYDTGWAEDKPGIIVGVGKDFKAGDLLSTDIRLMYTEGGCNLMLDTIRVWRISLLSKWYVTDWKISPTVTAGVEYTKKADNSFGGFNIPICIGVAFRN